MDAYCQGLATELDIPMEKAIKWRDSAGNGFKTRDDALWRIEKKRDRLDKGVEDMRAGNKAPPPPDVCIEGVEPIEWGSKEYDDKYGERDRRESRRYLRRDWEARGVDFDAMLARVQAERRANGQDIPDLHF